MLTPSRLILCLSFLSLLSFGCSPVQSGVVGCESGTTQACEPAGGCGGTQTCVDGVWSSCAPPVELCNGIDDDCDGEVDEGFPNLGQACAPDQPLCGESGTWTCSRDGSAVVCAADVVNPVLETCNGVDDDCNGEIDDVEGAGDACAVGVGACEQSGTRTCDPITGALVCNATPGTPSTEVCNGIDDDCDGIVDNVAGVGDACSVGEGACNSTGTRTCDVANGALICNATPGTPSTEVCNGIDDDCDGTIDNVAGLGDACSEGVGACNSPGTRVCDVSNGALICNATPGTPSTEVCNGIDDNCDGIIDNVDGVGDACSVGEGACNSAGTRVCDVTNGALVCNATPGTPSTEVCNGIDDNCDGTIDNVAGVGDACSEGVGACNSPGTRVCDASGGELVCNATPGTPSTEVCNGLDDDCNGTVDDVAGLGDACSVGVGACMSTGTRVCGTSGGALTCNATPGTPSTEVCNGIDDNCDGAVDNVAVSFSASVDFPSALRCAHLVIGDLDGDGRKDVVCAPITTSSVDPDTRLFLYRNLGDGSLGPVQYLQPVAGSPFRAQSRLALGDLDGDGDLDIVAVGETMRAQVYLNAGNGTFAAPYEAFDFTVSNEPGTEGLLLRDFDGDGHLDIATTIGTIRNSERRLVISHNNGSAGFGPPSVVDPAAISAGDILAADVENDGDIDLVVVGGNEIRLYRPTPTGSFEAPVTVATLLLPKQMSLLTDLDADGYPDLVLPAGGQRHLIPGTSSGFGPVSSISIGWTEYGVAAGQMDCDSTPELIILSSNAGAPLSYIPNPPDLNHVLVASGVHGHTVGLLDLDGDGDLDVVYGGGEEGLSVLLRN